MNEDEERCHWCGAGRCQDCGNFRCVDSHANCDDKGE